MLKAVAELQERGVEPHVWKLEGLARTSDYETVAAQCRANGRDHVACVVLGRGADAKRVEGWLRETALVPGIIGFAIGRSIWGKPLRALVAKELSRADAVEAVAGAFLHFAAEIEGGRRERGGDRQADRHPLSSASQATRLAPPRGPATEPSTRGGQGAQPNEAQRAFEAVRSHAPPPTKRTGQLARGPAQARARQD